jgi:hypothetical protein
LVFHVTNKGDGHMKRLAAVLLLLSTSANAAQTHHCAADAMARAKPLLKLHVENQFTKLRFDNPNSQEDSMMAGIDDRVKALGPIRALNGRNKYDVLEVWGHIRKADYRMRFIYGQLRGCILMGQEILEASDLGRSNLGR